MSEHVSQEVQPEQSEQSEQSNEKVGFLIHRHYLNDLSVENPVGRIADEDALKVQQGMDGRVDAFPMEGENRFRVDVRLQLTAVVESRTVFLAEITYRVEVELAGIAKELEAEVLCVEVPSAIFPMLQEVLQRNAGYAGYPDMQLAPLDYRAMFERNQQPPIK